MLNVKWKMKSCIAAVFILSSFAACQSMAQNALQDTLPDDYLPFTLYRLNDTYEGGCDFLEGFTISINVHPDSFENGVDEKAVQSIIRRQNITGKLTYPNGRITEIQYETVHHRETEEIYMKTTLGYFPWERVRISDDMFVFAIYWWYCPPASEVDVETLNMAVQLLSDSTHWHQNDDRKCDDDIEGNRWSLFCALKYASIEKMGEYNHHNTAIQTVRFIIDDLLPDHQFAHTLMDYNNSPGTTHNDILNVINLANMRIQEELTNREKQ